MLIAVKRCKPRNIVERKCGFPASWTTSRSQLTAFHFALQDLQNDRAILLEALKTNGYAIQKASAALRSDKNVVLQAVEKTGWALHSASNSLKNDPDITGAALASTFEAGVIRAMGEDIKRSLRTVLERLQDAKVSPKVFLDQPGSDKRGSAAVLYADRVWKRPCYETIWLLQHYIKSFGVGNDPQRKVIEFLGLEQQFKFAQQVEFLAPILSTMPRAGKDFGTVMEVLDYAP